MQSFGQETCDWCTATIHLLWSGSTVGTAQDKIPALKRQTLSGTQGNGMMITTTVKGQQVHRAGTGSCLSVSVTLLVAGQNGRKACLACSPQRFAG